MTFANNIKTLGTAGWRSVYLYQSFNYLYFFLTQSVSKQLVYMAMHDWPYIGYRYTVYADAKLIRYKFERLLDQ